MPEAFRWIVSIFQKHHVRFLVSGGLAAHAHGSPRPVRDIDFDIEESGLEKIGADVSPFVTRPVHRHKSRAFENTLLQLQYNGQQIDIASATGAKIYNDEIKEWEPDHTDLDRFEMREVFGLQVPVATREDMIAYKRKSPRPEDLIDIQALSRASE